MREVENMFHMLEMVNQGGDISSIKTKGVESGMN